eukprot:1560180-Prymnesium_polylepis.1
MLALLGSLSFSSGSAAQRTAGQSGAQITPDNDRGAGGRVGGGRTWSDTLGARCRGLHLGLETL